MTDIDAGTLAKIEQQLHLNCPSPEDALVRLSLIAARLPDDEIGARVRLLAVDIDDLIAQARWHLGQAILLLETQPVLSASDEIPDDPIQRISSMNTWPSKALLLARGYIRDADRVLYSDLAEPRRDGTVAGWVYHMMIDGAIFRIIAALDRLAQIVWHAAGLATTREKGKRVKVYFRSGKMKQVHDAVGNEHSRRLLDLAGSAFMQYVTDYRDNLTHDIKAYSKIAGTQPLAEWTTPDGGRVRVEPAGWDAETLFGFGNATYHHLTDALEPAVSIGEDSWPEGAGSRD